MLSRPTSLILWLASLYTLCVAQLANNTNRTGNLTCKPYGLCEQCPEEALHQPFCQPFGNRRLLHCRNTTSFSSISDSATTAKTDGETNTNAPDPNTRPHYAQRPPSHPDFPAPPFREGDGDIDKDTILAWESCGRVVSTERADFFEFVTVNLLFACVGIGIVVWRSRRMRLLHTRQLAARIGLVGRRR
ncbi:hypothetical protein D9756_008413 [Leucocoprinus leucothites]|uniref:Uncharacterized protein n=1 Tax=Leucocoprinus leucothites TaxID=201217 RepID=A0A8H5CZS2_9AGAR|nr:hypothetical protein D9756_008413 [Leucoagaricus leucothites]